MMTPSQKSTAPAPKPAGKNGSRTDGSLKTPSAAAARARQPHQPAGIKCPRCSSPNTKFCYYNNYNPAQPRHFCKTCRRYWTKGGALRNIPIGGGSRQSKKTTASFSSSNNDAAGINENGLRFFQGLSPAMDFQLDYYGAHVPPEPNPTSGFLSQLSSSFRDLSANSDGLVSSGNPNSFATVLNPDSGNESPPPPLDFSFPLYYKKEGGTGGNTLGFQDVGPSLGTSMDSVSYVNQDLHWKSQQQRLGLVFVGDYSNDNNCNNKESNLVPSSSAGAEALAQRPQPFWYKNMEISSADESCTVYASSSSKHDGINGDLSTEWLFGINNKNNNNSYAAFHEDQTQQITGSDDNSNSEKSSRNWSGFQAWTGLG